MPSIIVFFLDISSEMPARVAIVTGSNKGVGFATVRGLAKTFTGDVYLTSRNSERGMAAVSELMKENLTLHFHQLDIDDEASVIRLRDFMKDKYGGIDVLVNNAAIAFKNAATEPFAEQAEVTLATNYWSVKRSCEILFPILKPGARVVNVSSSAGWLKHIPSKEIKAKLGDANLTVDTLDGLMKDFVDSAKAGNHSAKGWPNSTYVVSKVGLSALSRIQQREFDQDPNSDLVVNHVHPGYVDTDMTSHKGPRTIDEGARSSIYAATLPPLTEIKGKYLWEDCTERDWLAED